jgi:hypothetical protein
MNQLTFIYQFKPPQFARHDFSDVARRGQQQTALLERPLKPKRKKAKSQPE